MDWWMAALGWNGFSESHKNLGGLFKVTPKSKPFPVDA